MTQINKFLLHRIKHTSKKHRASQGMTAAIILIAFIITAAGIAFVILTMGSSMQQNLGTIGEKGADAASSALQLEGGLVIGYNEATDVTGIDGFTFKLKVVLGTGEVNLAEEAITLFVIVNHGDQIEAVAATADTLDEESEISDAVGGTDCEYEIVWLNAPDLDVILEPNEIAKFFIQLETEVNANEEVTIVIITGVAMMKIQKIMPTGIDVGANILA